MIISKIRRCGDETCSGRTSRNFNSVRPQARGEEIAAAITPHPSIDTGATKLSLKRLVRGSILRGERYREQSRRRTQVSQRRLILVVGLVPNLTGIVAGFAVALVLALAGGRCGGYLLAVGRAPVQAGGRSQSRDGPEAIHPAANHVPAIT